MTSERKAANTAQERGSAERPAVRVHGVRKSYTGQGGITVALDDVNLTLPPGQVTCLLGPSGSGKTTLLGLIAGFEAPTQGAIFVGDRQVDGMGRDRLVVFQQPALFPWLTVWDNVTFGVRAHGRSESEYGAAAKDLVARMGLTGFERHYPYQLSGGMRQRLQIARTLLCDPEALLMDEPFGALDAQTRLGLQELMLKIWATSRPTVVFVTHDVDEAVLLGNQIVLLSARPGRVREILDVQLQEPRDYHTLTSPEFVRTKDHLLELIHKSD